MEHDPIIQALVEQVACYRRLAKLAEVQHEHIQHGRTEDLLKVLQSRQVVLDQLEAHERIVGPAKQKWGEFVAGLSDDKRGRADSLLAETRALLEKITTADRNDVFVLQQRKLNVGRQIQQTVVARQVNRNYSAAAYGTTQSRMDLQT